MTFGKDKRVFYFNACPGHGDGHVIHLVMKHTGVHDRVEWAEEERYEDQKTYKITVTSEEV